MNIRATDIITSFVDYLSYGDGNRLVYIYDSEKDEYSRVSYIRSGKILLNGKVVEAYVIEQNN